MKKLFCLLLSFLLIFSFSVSALADELPVEPENEPTELSEPEQGEIPSEPENEPTEPSEPEQGEIPSEPENEPTEPSEPEQGEIPSEPENEPTEPSEPEQGEIPSEPENEPTEPSESSKPEKEDEIILWEKNEITEVTENYYTVLPDTLTVDLTENSVQAVANAVGGSSISVTNKNGVTIDLIDISNWSDYQYHVISYNSGNNYYYYFYSNSPFYCTAETATKFRYAESGICGYGNQEVSFSWDQRDAGDAYSLSQIMYSDHDITVSDSDTVKYYSDSSASVEPDKFTVSFVTGLDDFVLDPVELTYGSVYSVPSFSYPNYKFLGIYTDEEFTKPYLNTPITEDTVFYLKFEEVLFDHDLMMIQIIDRLEGLIYMQTVLVIIVSASVIGFFFFNKKSGLGI